MKSTDLVKNHVSSKVLSERAILIHLHIKGWSASVKDEDATNLVVNQYSVNSADRVTVKKSLVDPDILKPVKNATQAARTFHTTNSSPWLDNGFRLIGSAKLDSHCQKLRELKGEWEKAVRELALVLPGAIEAGKAELGGLGKDEDYLSAEEILSKFDFGFDLVPVPDKRDIRVELSAEGMREAEESVSRVVEQTSQRIVGDIRDRVAKVVTKIVEKLSATKPDGKHAIFRDGLVENAKELIPLIRELNVLEDAGVEDLARNLEKALGEVDPDQIRVNPEYREKVIDSSKSILDAMSASGYGADEDDSKLAA